MTVPSIVHQALQMSIKDGKERVVVEKPNGEWAIFDSQYSSRRGDAVKYEIVNSAFGWVSREVGGNFQSGRSSIR